MTARQCTYCQRVLPLSSFYPARTPDRRLTVERMCIGCKRAIHGSPYLSRHEPDNPAPLPAPGECMIGDCHQPVDEDHGALCFAHYYHYVLSAEAHDMCRCGEKLASMYALARGSCFACAYSGTTYVAVTVVAGTPTITVVGAVSVSGMSMAG